MSFRIHEQRRNGIRIKKKIDRRWMIDTIARQQEILNAMAQDLYYMKNPHLAPKPPQKLVQEAGDVPMIMPVNNSQVIAEIAAGRI